jgi:hypothetical protein
LLAAGLDPDIEALTTKGKLLDLLKGTPAEGAKQEPAAVSEVKTGEKDESRVAAPKRHGADKAAPDNG